MSSSKHKLKWPLTEDLIVFLTVIRKNSFSGAAKDLGQSNAYITKRINVLEETLNTKLFYRNTRQLKLTSSGEFVRKQAHSIVKQMEYLTVNVVENKKQMSGRLHICSSFGFGRTHLPHPLSLFAKEYPELEIELTLTDHKNDLIKENIDLEIAVGNDLNASYFAKKLSDNKRILCASPNYIQQHGIPLSLKDLESHQCLFLKEKDSPFGIWKLSNGSHEYTITVKGGLTTNNGEVILQWALAGHGIIYRSLWDAQKYLSRGQLIHVLADYYEDASIWAVYPHKLTESLKVEVCVNFLMDYFTNKKIT